MLNDHYRGFKKNSIKLEKDNMHLSVYCSIICSSQVTEATQMSIDRWRDKEDEVLCVHIHTYTHSGIVVMKKNEILPFVNVDGPRGYPDKWNKSKRQIVWFHLYVQSIKIKNRSKSIIQRTNRGLPEREVGGCSKRCEGEWEIQALVMEWISHGDQRYSIGTI